MALDNPSSSDHRNWGGSKDDDRLARTVGNALIRRWSGFRREAPGVTWESFRAALTSMEVGSWQWPSVRNDCHTEACYPVSNGLQGLSDALDTVPVPTGHVELPIALNLRHFDDNPAQMTGRVNTEYALQYPGNPKVTLAFANDPIEPSRQLETAELVFIEDFRFDVAVGARYETNADDSNCVQSPSDDLELVEIPWLVPGFERGVSRNENGRRVRHACRDTSLPLEVEGTQEMAINQMLAMANPIPDARIRHRTVSLVDGAMINNRFLFIIFKEQFNGLDEQSDDFAAWGYMMLERKPVDLDQTDTNGNSVPDVYEGNDQRRDDDTLEAQGVLDVSCSEDLTREILDGRGEITDANALSALRTLIEGRRPEGGATYIEPETSTEEVHYLCEETGLFNGGGDLDVRIPCPAGSRVEFFTVDSTVKSEDDIAREACQQPQADMRGTCATRLQEWKRARPAWLIQTEPYWRCAVEDRTLCSDDRHDLREGKRFYDVSDEGAIFAPLMDTIQGAFRYKTRFRNRQGTSVGFAPQICLPNSSMNPYCYEPADIERTRERIDCMLYIWRNHYDALEEVDGDTRHQARLVDLLKEIFAQTNEEQFDGSSISRDGFEHLHAELLVMMGDESYTRSFKSRFDLAGASTLAFEGSRLEPGGIDLAGIAGYEMYNLYQATQYYQEALDRFYSLSPLIWESLSHGNARNFITAATATTYLERLIRASTQKTRALSEIARRYQSLNRPDLARLVIERAYAGAYLESIILSRIMEAVVPASELTKRDQIRHTIEEAQRRYRMALLAMRNVYETITNEVNVFGFAPDYIPFPTIDARGGGEGNAFEQMFIRTQNKVRVAREREDLAIQNNRTFETDAAQFQAELVRIRNNYENQLDEICGSFEAEDGHVYPAIAKYAHLDPIGAVLGDPCGLLGNGAIHEEHTQLDIIKTDLKCHIVAGENILESVKIKSESVAQQCALIEERANYHYERAGERKSLDADIRELQFDLERMDKDLNMITQASSIMTSLAQCATAPSPIGKGSCAASVGVEKGIVAGASFNVWVQSNTKNKQILRKQKQLANIDQESGRWETLRECDRIEILGNEEMMTRLLDLKTNQIEMLQDSYRIDQTLSKIERLRHKAKRLQEQQHEAEQLAINVEAARNDPNIRIYKNDAIINADFAFEQALHELYLTTRVFEYYTSQSYAAREQLFLMRMVARGEYNLENYLQELQNAFYEFEDDFGLPDTRVMVVSLMNDILKIPRVDKDGRALSAGDREDLMRAEFRNPARLDRNGHLVFTFRTSLDKLSPLTRNHKILYMQAAVVIDDHGDSIARLYLRQRGTGTIHSITDTLDFYRFPKKTAVINPVFGTLNTSSTTTIFAPEVYRTLRFRDRPLANSAWDLIINQRDEEANKDIDLQKLTDIKLRVYYTDFTELPR